MVVKADGLAAGKGVAICTSRQQAVAAVDEMMRDRRFGEAGCRIVIEEFLRGEEASVHAITDGDDVARAPVVPRPQARSEMGTRARTRGAWAPTVPRRSSKATMMDRIMRTVLVPMVHGMKNEGAPFKGVLYAGMMITKGGPRVLEFNVRFGDPETQVLLPGFNSDFAEILWPRRKAS